MGLIRRLARAEKRIDELTARLTELEKAEEETAEEARMEEAARRWDKGMAGILSYGLNEARKTDG